MFFELSCLESRKAHTLVTEGVGDGDVEGRRVSREIKCQMRLKFNFPSSCYNVFKLSIPLKADFHLTDLYKLHDVK